MVPSGNAAPIPPFIPAPPTPPTYDRGSGQQDGGGKGPLWAVIAILACIILIGGVIAAFALGGNNDEPTFQKAEESLTEKTAPKEKTTPKKSATPKKKATPKKATPKPATPAVVRYYPHFVTPSGNITCIVGGESLRCELRNNDVAVPAPADCDLDYGNTFMLDQSGPAYRLCHGDTVSQPGIPVLAYGEKNTIDGFTCESSSSALTCTSSGGGYMRLSRQAQTLR